MTNTVEVIGNYALIHLFKKGTPLVAVIDKADLPSVSRVGRWYGADSNNSKTVAQATLQTHRRRVVRMQQLILGHRDGDVIVHVDGDGLNNQRSNLVHRLRKDVSKRPALSTHWRSARAAARRMMERHLGRTLDRHEHVHHINGDFTDNRLDNLEVMSASEHTRMHGRARAKYTPEERRERKMETAPCSVCRRPFHRVKYGRKIKTCSRPCASLQMSEGQKRRVFQRNPQANNTSGIRGVHFHKRLKSKPYSATLAGRYLGYFASAAEAEAAINVALAELSHG